MKQSRTRDFRLVPLVMLCTGLANAQEPGTNMATPAPATAPGAAPTEPSMTPMAPQATVAQEPVIDPQTTTTTLPNRPLLVTGLVLLGGSYAAAAVVAATSERDEDERLFYPVVGPWWDLSERDCRARPCNDEDLNKGLLIGDGVVQGLGALSIVLSMFVPEKRTRRWYLIGNDSLVLAPRVGSAMTGLTAAGHF